MQPTREQLRRWQQEAWQRRREEVRSMTPLQRMELAYRLFRLTREAP